MNNINLYVDFGNIFTKVTAIDIDNREVLGVFQSFSTMDTNILEGLKNATNNLKSKLNDVKYKEIYACSSIDAGLKMVTVGIVSRLSTNASGKAALGAGVNVLKSYSGKLTDDDIREINELDIDMVLLCGGTDGGNKDCVIYNSKKLLGIDKNVSIIYAGNKDALYNCRIILEKSFKDFRVSENVMPQQYVINIEPVRKTIRETYVERIYKLDMFYKTQREITGLIMPTSNSILNAAALLSQGTDSNDGIGDLMVVDCGGKYTNIYSIGEGSAENKDVILQGIPEPLEKRTFEHFGLRNNIKNVLNIYDIEFIKKEFKKIDKSINAEQYIEELFNNPRFLPANEVQYQIDDLLCRLIIEKSIDNHVGTIEKEENALFQYGKNLTNVSALIGVGGIISNSYNSKNTLESLIGKNKKLDKLRPMNPDIYIYNQDIMYALGLLSKDYPEEALVMLKKYLAKL